METPPPNKRRGPKPVLDSELVAAALVDLRGNISAVARKFGVDRHTVRTMIDRKPTLKRILSDAREGMLDDAESALYSSVVAREGWAVCFLLKTQGKSRGYVEKQEIDYRNRDQQQEEKQMTDDELIEIAAGKRG